MLISFLYPEIFFSLFLMPTKFTSLTEKLHISPYLSPANLLFVFMSGIIIITVLLNQKCIVIPKRLFFPYTGFILLMTISISYSPAFDYGLAKTTEFILMSTLACFAPFFLLKDLKTFERFLKTFITLGILLGVFIFISSPYAFQFYSSNSSYPKFQTTIGNNYLALQYILGISLLAMIYYFLFKEKIRKRITVLSIMLIGLFGAALMYSPGKGPIISLFFTVVIMTLLSLKIEYQKILIKRKIMTYALLIFGGGALLLSTIGWMFILRLQALLQPGYYGQVERSENIKIAIDVFLNHPFFGAGIGSFSHYAGVFEGIERMKYPHSLPLEILTEMGFVGFILLILVLGFSLRQLLHLAKKYRSTPYYNIPNAVLSFFVFTFLASLTGGNINNPLLFAWAGIAYVLEPIIKRCMKNENEIINQR